MAASTAPLRLVRSTPRRVAAAVPVITPVAAPDAPPSDGVVVPIGRNAARDAITVATWVAEHLPANASPLRIAMASPIERNWIALESLGPDHRPVDWPQVIGALREIASVPLANAGLVPSA
jgi:hypothetical protein